MPVEVIVPTVYLAAICVRGYLTQVGYGFDWGRRSRKTTTAFILPLVDKQDSGKKSILLFTAPTKKLQKDQFRLIWQCS
jgi:hypothetical protein